VPLALPRAVLRACGRGEQEGSQDKRRERYLHGAGFYERSALTVQCRSMKSLPELTAALLLSTAGPSAGDEYEDLGRLFEEWRAFQSPVFENGVPDYTAKAIAEQARGLESFGRRLANIDRSRWPIPRQVDYELVRAEMNGLDFDHRVLRPWSRNPGFYRLIFPSETDVPRREGPVHAGAIELWQYRFPLSGRSSASSNRWARSRHPRTGEKEPRGRGEGPVGSRDPREARRERDSCLSRRDPPRAALSRPRPKEPARRWTISPDGSRRSTRPSPVLGRGRRELRLVPAERAPRSLRLGSSKTCSSASSAAPSHLKLLENRNRSLPRSKCRKTKRSTGAAPTRR
jgi:hypothetical protein